LFGYWGANSSFIVPIYPASLILFLPTYAQLFLFTAVFGISISRALAALVCQNHAQTIGLKN
jgi:hypothetical protein